MEGVPGKEYIIAVIIIIELAFQKGLGTRLG